MVLPDGGGRLEPLPFDQPACVVDLPKDEQRLTELLDGVERAHPEQVLLERADEALGTAIPLAFPSGARTKAGELSMPRKASSFWKASDNLQVRDWPWRPEDRRWRSLLRRTG